MSLSVFSLGPWVAVGFAVLVFGVRFWIKKYALVAVHMRKITIEEGAKLVAVFGSLVEGLPVIRCSRAEYSGGEGTRAEEKKYSAAIIGELMIAEKFEEAMERTNVSFQHEMYVRQWINIRLEMSLAFLTGLICILIWLSKVRR